MIILKDQEFFKCVNKIDLHNNTIYISCIELEKIDDLIICKKCNKSTDLVNIEGVL